MTALARTGSTHQCFPWSAALVYKFYSLKKSEQ